MPKAIAVIEMNIDSDPMLPDVPLAIRIIARNMVAEATPVVSAAL
jgi:hypothetical protein